MEPTVLMEKCFWSDPSSVVMGEGDELPDVAGLSGLVLFQTSGSMGAAKWVALSKQALQVSAEAVNAHLGVTADSCWGLALPLRHVGGFGVVARAHQAGCRLAVFAASWNTAAYAEWVEEEGVTHTSLVPTQVHDLVTATCRAPASLKAVVVGGGHLPQQTGQAARDLGWPVLASYGMTEAGSQIATQSPASLDEAYRPAPIPVLPIWQVDVDADDRLIIQGKALFSGVVAEEKGQWEFHPREQGSYRTSDRARLDEHGIHPLGRADLRVKVLGELVDLSEVETTLEAASAGSLKAGSFVVLALPHERNGHVLIPVFDASCDPDAMEAAMTRYQAEAAGYERLGSPVRLEVLPKSGLGKVRRQACLTEVLKQLGD